MASKAGYQKFKAREWEGIEDKLKSLCIEDDLPEIKDAYPKDFIKQLKDHIKEIIATGKEVKIATLSRYIQQEKRFKGTCANY